MRLPVDVIVTDLKLVLTRFADDPSTKTYSDVLKNLANLSDMIEDVYFGTDDA